jgi:hypothetical protein
MENWLIPKLQEKTEWPHGPSYPDRPQSWWWFADILDRELDDR